MVKILINGVDRTAYIWKSSISINDSLTVKSDSLTFEMDIKELEISAPQGGNLVEVRHYFDAYPSSEVTYGIYDPDEILYDDTEALYYYREFAGMVVTVDRQWASPPKWIKYTCSCSDYTRFFDRRLVNFVYTAGQYAGDIAIDIINEYTSGFTTNHVERGVKVPEQTFDFVEPSAAIQSLAEAIGYQWFIDTNKDVHFFWHEDKVSPLALVTSNIYNVDTDISYCYNLTMSEDISQVKNQIMIKNAMFKADKRVNDDFVQANKKAFAVLYDIFPYPSGSTSEVIDTYIRVELLERTGGSWNHVKYYTTVLVDGIDGVSGDGRGDANTIYVNFDKRGFRLPDNFGLAEDGTEMLRVYYHPLGSVPVLEISRESIEEMQNREGPESSGTYEFCFDASSIYTEKGEELSAAVDRVLLRYKDPAYTGKFQSRLNGWKAGQTFKLYSKIWGDSTGSPLDMIVFIQGVTKSVLKHDIMEYTIEFSSSPFGE